MNRRIHLIAISWIGALAGLTLLTLALTAGMPVQAVMADSSISVSITESGFDPSVVTITVGATVVWTNHTQKTVHLVSGEPYCIYLPLMLRDADDTRVAATSPPMTDAVVARRQANWGNVNIAPGESYTHTFATDGNYPYFLAGHPDRTGLVVVQRTLTPDFALGVQPLAQEVMQGESVTYTAVVTALYGFDSPVTLTVDGTPTGAIVSWAINSLTPTAGRTLMLTPTADATLIITPSMSSLTDTFALVIIGTGGGQVHTTTVMLSVTPRPGFELGVRPLAREVEQGESVTYTVAVTALHGFADPVALDVGGAPTGTTVSWATNPVTSTADTTLTIIPSASGPTGTFTLVITGTGGERVHSTPFTLTVTSSPCPQTGSWSGTTSQGRSISLTVSDTFGCQVESLTINLLCPTFWWLASMGPEPITDNHFEAYERDDYFGFAVTVIGDFTSSTVVSGTWYSNASCYGTWAANYTP